MTTATRCPTRDLLLPAAGIALAAASWAFLTGTLSTDLLASPFMGGVLCCTLFGSFAAISLAQAPRKSAPAQVVVTSQPRGGDKAIAAAADSPEVVAQAKKKAA